MMKPICLIYLSESDIVRYYSLPYDEMLLELHDKIVNIDEDITPEQISLLVEIDSECTTFTGRIDPQLFSHIVVTGWY